MEDAADLAAADCVVSFTEAPRSTSSRGGRHVEFGMALGLRKHCVVIGPRENVFHCLPQVAIFRTLGQFIEQLPRHTALALLGNSSAS